MEADLIFEGHERLGKRKYGFIDKAGRLVVPGGFDWVGSFSEGLARVQIGPFLRARHGYIDINGALEIPLTFTSTTDFKNGFALAKRRGRRHRGLHALLDRTGRTIRELPYRMMDSFSEGLARVWHVDTYGFVDLEGRWVIEPQFDHCEAFQNGLAAVSREDWFGLINSTGQFMWGPRNEGSCNQEIRADWLD
jgi:hypothetical protein